MLRKILDLRSESAGCLVFHKCEHYGAFFVYFYVSSNCFLWLKQHYISSKFLIWYIGLWGHLSRAQFSWYAPFNAAFLLRTCLQGYSTSVWSNYKLKGPGGKNNSILGWVTKGTFCCRNMSSVKRGIFFMCFVCIRFRYSESPATLSFSPGCSRYV